MECIYIQTQTEKGRHVAFFLFILIKPNKQNKTKQNATLCIPLIFDHHQCAHECRWKSPKYKSIYENVIRLNGFMRNAIVKSLLTLKCRMRRRQRKQKINNKFSFETVATTKLLIVVEFLSSCLLLRLPIVYTFR